MYQLLRILIRSSSTYGYVVLRTDSARTARSGRPCTRGMWMRSERGFSPLTTSSETELCSRTANRPEVNLLPYYYKQARFRAANGGVVGRLQLHVTFPR